jgi:hypothetical protein
MLAAHHAFERVQRGVCRLRSPRRSRRRSKP